MRVREGFQEKVTFELDREDFEGLTRQTGKGCHGKEPMCRGTWHVGKDKDCGVAGTEGVGVNGIKLRHRPRRMDEGVWTLYEGEWRVMAVLINLI